MTNRQRPFSQLALTRLEPSSRTVHKRLLTEIQPDSASLALVLTAIAKPASQRALETKSPDTRRVK